jgi:7-cyano-7-deazaguanine reductase
VLDRVPNPHPDTDYVARFTFPEFTTLCPVSGQPDFAIVAIDYLPRRNLVESKSLKLYLNSFRNHPGFHEDCTVAIGKPSSGSRAGRKGGRQDKGCRFRFRRS